MLFSVIKVHLNRLIKKQKKLYEEDLPHEL